MFKPDSPEEKKKKQDIFIKECNEKFGNKFDYTKVLYDGIQTKVIIICPEHGEILQTPANHKKSKYGCMKCKNVGLSLTQEEFIEKAKKVHGDKFNYDNTVYVNYSTKIKVVCKKHTEFEVLAGNHLAGHSECPNCRNITESKILNFLQKEGYVIKREVTIKKEEKRYRFDFLINEFILLECDGDQHFDDGKKHTHIRMSSEDIFKNDIIKMGLVIDTKAIIRVYQPDVWKDNFDWKTFIRECVIKAEVGKIYIHDRHKEIYKNHTLTFKTHILETKGSIEKVKKEISLEFMDDTDYWKSNLDKLIKFHLDNNRKPNEATGDDEEQILARWMYGSVTNYNNNKFMLQYQNVREMWKNFINDPRFEKYYKTLDDKWNNNINELLKYIDEHKKRPEREKEELGDWTKRQIRNYKYKIDSMNDIEHYNIWTNLKNNPIYKYFLSTEEEQTFITFYENLEKVKEFIITNKRKPKRTDMCENENKLANFISLHNTTIEGRTGLMRHDELYKCWTDIYNSEEFGKFLKNRKDTKEINKKNKNKKEKERRDKKDEKNGKVKKIRMKYDLTLIETIKTRDNCVIVSKLDKNINVNRETRIDFICKCGKSGDKALRNMYENGALCHDCSVEKSKKIRSETNIKAIGYANYAQSPDIKNKIKERKTGI